MSHVQTGNVTHDQTVNKSEGVRQSAVSAASTQAAVVSAEITHYKACAKSALANNCGVTTFVNALRELGVQGL